ncbi:MAG: hypothetical protein O2963_00205 [Proteobacteria bacterium]|nr:hypothetical protein [Pseudomonadota bacterium]
MLMCALLGRWPWEPVERTGWFWEAMGWQPPIRIRWVGQDWEKHIKTVIEKQFDELWPSSIQVRTKKNNGGVRALWTEPRSGSTIEIMSNNQESDLFEGWNGHVVAYDEPPKRPVRVACARGLIDYRGREIFAMTLLKEAWVDQEVVNAINEDGTPDMTVFNYNAEIGVNIGFGITQEGVDQFAKSLTEEEKQARLKGIPSYKSGLVLHIDRGKHFIPRVRIPSHWIIDISIDVHPQKPQHILFQATDEHNFHYLVFEIVGHGDGAWIGDQIMEKITRYSLRVNQIIIDPLSKSDGNNPATVYENVRIVLARGGYILRTAEKWKSDGIIAINDRLWSKNGLASYFIFSDLPVTVRQLTGWMYEDNGEPSKKNDDMCENAYRLALLDTQYVAPEDEDDETRDEGRSRLSGVDAGY